jgi:hypothetical protein
MAAFGEIIIDMIYTIISSIVYTTFTVLNGLYQLFNIIYVNLGNLSPLAIILAVIILGLTVYALFRIFKGQAKILIIAVAVLILITLMTILML